MTNPQGQNPAQPTGKRQLRGATSVPTQTSMASATPAKVDEKKSDKVGGGPAAFPGEVVSEMRKVIWPTGRQMVNYTLIVFGFLIVLTAIVWSVDAVSRWGVEQILIN